MADFSSVSSVKTNEYNNIIIPINEDNINKIVSGEVKINFLSETLSKRLLDEIRIQKFKAECSKSIWVSEVFEDSKAVVMLYGIGNCACDTSCQKIKFLAKLENFGAKLFNPSCLKEKVLIVGDFIGINTDYTPSRSVCQMALGFLQASYRFDRYMTTQKNKDKNPKLKSLSVFVSKNDNIDSEVQNTIKILHSLYLVRDLVNEPANILYPESYSNIIEEQFKGLSNVKVKVLDAKELEKIGMNMLLGVGIGSVKESKVVIIEYTGNSTKKDNDVAFVGKGVTFDTGGISIKPAKGMEDMKGDMAGSASVVGTLKLLADRKANVNAIGIVGLVENMPSGSAQRPGDIVKSLSGQTVEVLNTDAEGRLVLGDILYYAQTTYKPTYMIDLATLTGAIVVALGAYYAGMYSNSDELADMLTLASKKTGESVWRMPLDERFDKMNDSTFADMRNVTNSGQAGSITAAEFLHRFIGDNKNWSHLDIAGVSDVSGESNIAQKGCSTAFGVKLLNQFVIDNLEKKS